MDNFSDTLIMLAEKKESHVFVEISPKSENFPDFLREKYQSAGGVLFAFYKEIIDKACDKIVGIVIDKSAFELFGPGGVMAGDMIAKYAHQKGVVCVVDGAFGGQGAALENYIDAYLTSGAGVTDAFFADAITLSPYNDADILKDAASYAIETGKGLFMYVRTTKTSDKTQFENIVAKDDEEPIWYFAADDAATFSENYVGERGYSSMGIITFASRDGVKIRGVNRWSLALTRATLSDLDEAENYSFFYKGEGEGQFFVLGDDAVFAWMDNGGNAENFAETAATVIENAAKKIENNK